MQYLRKAVMFAIFCVAIYYLAQMKPRSNFDPEIEAFIKKYFATWSKHDLGAYTNTFKSNARIYVEEPGSSRTEFSLGSFLASQETAFAKYPGAYEEPGSITVYKDGDVVSCEATWVLKTGSQTVTGTDTFKLKRQDDRWLITELIVHNDTKINAP